MSNATNTPRQPSFLFSTFRRTPVWPIGANVLDVDLDAVRRDAKRLFEASDER